MWTDLRLAVRTLAATRTVSTIAVLSLALGIGANTAIFSLVNSVLLRPLPVAEPHRLVTVATDFAINLGFKAGAGWSYAMWDRLQQRSQAFDGAFAWCARRLNLGRAGEGQPVNGLYVSGGFFATLGVPALHGRVFTPGDDVRGGGESQVVVISHSLWQRRFGGALNVVGTPLVVEGVPFTIVGVTPPEFLGLEVGQSFDVALPLNSEPLVRGKDSGLMHPRNYALIVMLRLKPGQSLRAATATIRGMQPEMVPADAPKFVQEPITLAPAAEGTSGATAGAAGLRQRFQRPLLTILAVVALVLLVACVNIANLLLARAAARRHELSVRVALGASRWRLARQLLVESLVLAGAGATVGLMFAAWFSRALVAQLSTSVSHVVLDLSLDWRVAAFTGATTVATALLFGVVPALRSTRVAPMDALKADGRRASGGGTSRLSSGLVVAQVALALVLVVVAGLLVRTFERLVALPLGFDTNRVLVANVDATRAGIDPDSRLLFYQRLVDAVAMVPGVERAAGSMWTPMSGGGALLGVSVPGAQPTAERGGVVANFITPGWFSAYGTPFRQGRDVDARDTATVSPVLVVNEAFVRKFFPDGDPVGRTVTLGAAVAGGAPARTVIGVVRDAVFRSGRMVPGVASLALRDAVPPMIYVPLAQSAGMGPPGSTSISISVRSAGRSPVTLAPGVAAALTAVDGDLAFTFRPLSDFVNASLAEERVVAMLAGFFGALALLLAALGLYGVTSYAVSLRRTEIGIRMALGAQRSDVLALVLRRAVVMTAIGIVLGLACAATLTRLLEGMLFGLTPLDPSTFFGVSLLLAAVVTLAAFVPARRATKVDPLVALRSE